MKPTKGQRLIEVTLLMPFFLLLLTAWIPPATQSGHCPVQSGPPETWEGRDRVPVRFIQATSFVF